jgi:beta-N-acetylhexosaminidase
VLASRAARLRRRFLSFTPVLDLDWGPSGVIGDRAFHRDPRVVTLLAKSLMHGLLQAGMANCGKHFPGHGFVKRPTAHAVPVDRAAEGHPGRRRRALRLAGTTLASVMPAHVVYPKVDPAPPASRALAAGHPARPAGLHGAIFSDDLSMEGARRIDGREVSYPPKPPCGAGRRLRPGAAVQPGPTAAARSTR